MKKTTFAGHSIYSTNEIDKDINIDQTSTVQQKATFNTENYVKEYSQQNNNNKLVISENKKITMSTIYKITEQDIEKLNKKYPNFYPKFDDILERKKKILDIEEKIKKENKSHIYNKSRLEFLYNSWLAYFDFQFEAMKILRNETNLIKKFNLSLQKEISLTSTKSSKIILAAFFLQLFIFMIIQALEISTTINSGKNEKR